MRVAHRRRTESQSPPASGISTGLADLLSCCCRCHGIQYGACIDKLQSCQYQAARWWIGVAFKVQVFRTLGTCICMQRTNRFRAAGIMFLVEGELSLSKSSSNTVIGGEISLAASSNNI